MNILFITTNWRETGGDWTFTKEFIKIFEKNGHKVIPFAMEHPENLPSNYSRYFIEKINYSDLNQNKNLSNGIKVLSKSIYSKESKNNLISLLNDVSIDIVQILNIHNTHTLSILPEIHKRKIPIVWRVIDYKILCPNRSFLANGKICEACFGHKYYQPFVKKCKKQSRLASLIASFEGYFNQHKKFYDLVDFYSLQSNFSHSLFKKYGFEEYKLGVVGNPYRTPSKQNALFSNEKKTNTLLYIGRLSEEKGLLTLLKAMQRNPNLTLNIVGDGPQKEEIDCFIESNKLSNVNMLGRIWSDQLDTIISSSLMLIVPSEWYEPNPYVVLQAYENEIPVIASNIGGLPDMVQENKTGLLFKMGDFVELSDKIQLLYKDKELRKKLGKNGRSFLENYKPEKFYSYHIDLYQKLLKKKI